MRDVLITSDTRSIVQLDPPADLLITDDLYQLVSIDDAEAAKIGQGNARYTLAADNTVQVVNVPVVPAPDTVARQTILDSYQSAVARLQDIQTNGGSYTLAQARGAIVDMAGIILALVRYTRALL